MVNPMSPTISGSHLKLLEKGHPIELLSFTQRSQRSAQRLPVWSELSCEEAFFGSKLCFAAGFCLNKWFYMILVLWHLFFTHLLFFSHCRFSWDMLRTQNLFKKENVERDVLWNITHKIRLRKLQWSYSQKTDLHWWFSGQISSLFWC